MLVLCVIEWASREKDGPMTREPQLWIRTISAMVLVGLALWGGQPNAALLVALIALVFLVQVGLDIYARLRRSGIESRRTVGQERGSGSWPTLPRTGTEGAIVTESRAMLATHKGRP